MTTGQNKRISTLTDYLTLKPKGDAHDIVAGELLSTLTSSPSLVLHFKGILATGWSAALEIFIDKVFTYGSQPQSCPLMYLEGSFEGLEDTKKSLGLIARFITSEERDRAMASLDLARHFDEPDLLDWIEDNITTLNLDLHLPRILPVELHAGPQAPKLAALLQDIIDKADFAAPNWQNGLEHILDVDDPRLHLSVLRAGAPTTAYLRSEMPSSHTTRKLRPLLESRHGQLSLHAAIPEDILAWDKKAADAIIDTLTLRTATHA